MKIVLKTGDVFQVSSVFMQTENQLCISFTGITSYDSLRAKLTVNAMKQIKEYSNETDFVSHENFTKFISANFTDAGDGTSNVSIIFEREDEVHQRLSYLEEQLSSTNTTLDWLLTDVVPYVDTTGTPV
jgi:hypothetical protein